MPFSIMPTLSLSSGFLIIAGLINLAPAIGVLSAQRLEALYGVPVAGQPDLEILLRHRAVLFGLLGAAMVYGAFDHAWFWPVLVVGLISMLAYAALSFSVGGYNASLRFVLIMDLFGVAAALAAGAMRAITT